MKSRRLHVELKIESASAASKLAASASGQGRDPLNTSRSRSVKLVNRVRYLDLLSLYTRSCNQNNRHSRGRFSPRCLVEVPYLMLRAPFPRQLQFTQGWGWGEQILPSLSMKGDSSASIVVQCSRRVSNSSVVTCGYHDCLVLAVSNAML